MSVRTRLLLLCLGIILPGAIGAIWGLNALHEQQRLTASVNLTEITRAMAAVVDRELDRRESTLRTLALAPSLREGDIASFYTYAKAVAASPETSIVLVSLDGVQLMNTRAPFGAELPKAAAFAGWTGTPKSDEVVVSDLFFAPVSQRYSFSVRVPVVHDERVIGYLGMGTFVDALQNVVNEQPLRPGWNASILDFNGTILARRLNPESFVGAPATERLRVEVRTKTEGVFESVRLDGTPTLTAYAPIGHSNWTLVMSMPKSDLDQQIGPALKATIAVSILMLFVAIALAAYVARSIARPIRDLVLMARAVSDGERVVVPQGGLAETEIVATELKQAGERIRTANEVMQRKVRDAVSETKRAQAALLQNQKLEALGKLTSGISHDFNNLLQTIGGALELAARTAGAATVKAVSESGKRAVQRATKLTRQLTTFSRGSVCERTSVDLRRQLREAEDLLKGAVRENVQLTIDTAPNLWPVYVDAAQLEIALLNVALNARDAMPGGGRLTMVARNTEVGPDEVAELPAGDYVRLTVQDTGVGIPAHIVDRVFEPFFTTKPVGEGSGLGLAQVYGFAKQAGGSVSIDSEVGHGTIVQFLLPRASNRAIESAASENVSTIAPAEKRHVLFVEDDPLVREVVVPGLASAGFDVTAVPDAASALDKLRESPVHVVFSDIVMPGAMDGIALAHEIKRRYPDMPVILATGYAEATSEVSSQFRIVHKPYTLDQASQALGYALLKPAA